MKKTIFILIAVSLLVTLLFACCSPPIKTPKLDAAPNAFSTQEASTPPSTEAVKTPLVLPAFDEIIADHAFSSSCVPDELYPADTDLKGYAVILKHPETTQSLTDCFDVWLSEAVSAVQNRYQEYYPRVSITADIEAPSWQLLSSVAYGCASPEDFTALFPSLIHVKITKNDDFSDDYASFDLTVTAVRPQQLFYTLPRTDESDPSSIPSGFFMCTYLSTAYDENMEMITPDEENLPVLSETLTFPLPDRYDYVDSWYDDRDGGARRHTGTDILCPERTPELACVDGTILAVGTGDGTGNYVVIGGSDGTQYHYYHMVEVSTFVSASDKVSRGDVVGLAGNTGNSTANHLHLAIIHPSGVYVNPYPYLSEAVTPEDSVN